MPQDAFTLRLSARELDAALKGGKINKIIQPEREEVSFLIYTGKRTVKLTLNANASDCGVYLTDDERENPAVAPNFCMLLRKHLLGAEILKIETVGFERVVAVTLLCHSDFSSSERILYAEVMGKYSNLILTEGGRILGALKTTFLQEQAKRTIMTGAKYRLPAPQEKANPSDFAALSAALNTPQALSPKFLFSNVAGLALCTAEQIVEAYRGGDFAKHVYDYIFSDDLSPCVYTGPGKADFFARYRDGARRYSSLTEAQSNFYRDRRAQKRMDGIRRKLSAAIGAAVKKTEKRLSQILEKREECCHAEENRIAGDLLTANLYCLTRGMHSCELNNFYDEQGGKLKITLDPVLTPSQNAQNYYKKYRKQSRTLEMLAPQEAEQRAEIDYLNSLTVALDAARDTDDLLCLEEELVKTGIIKPTAEKTKKKTVEIPFRTFEYDGFRIFAGRNNLQNDRLIRSSSPDDIWLHAHLYHSAHVVIRTEGKSVTDAVLRYAAELCAQYTGMQGDRIDVDYCPIKFVKKPPKAKAGFVTYSNYKTIKV